MITILALVVLAVLMEAAIITLILWIYRVETLREAWSETWSKPWVPIVLAIASLLAAL